MKVAIKDVKHGTQAYLEEKDEEIPKQLLDWIDKVKVFKHKCPYGDE